MTSADERLIEVIARALYTEGRRPDSADERNLVEWERLRPWQRVPWVRTARTVFFAIAREHARERTDSRVTNPGPIQTTPALTRRERAILTHLTTCATGRQIADHECITMNTLKTHVRHIYRKLGVADRAAAATAAHSLGIGQPGAGACHGLARSDRPV